MIVRSWSMGLASVGRCPRLLLLGCLLGVVWLAAVAADPANAGVVRTAGCPGAFEWHVRLELHRTPERRAEDPEMSKVITEAQQAADMVGEATGCAAALAFDVVDDPGAWDTSGGRFAELERLREREAQPGPWQDVDLTILSRPKLEGDTFLGTSDSLNVVVSGEPWLTVTIHELFHVFESFYAGAPWPDRVADEDAIHEQDQWGYPPTYDGVVAFQRDLLAGTVGGNLGMPRAGWAVPETLRQRKARLREERSRPPVAAPAPQPGVLPLPAPGRAEAPTPRPWSLGTRLSLPRKGKLKLVIEPESVAVGQPARIRLKIPASKCRGCRRAQRFKSRVVALRRRTTVRLGRLPRRARGGTATIRVAPFRADGIEWAGATAALSFGR